MRAPCWNKSFWTRNLRRNDSFPAMFQHALSGHIDFRFRDSRRVADISTRANDLDERIAGDNAARARLVIRREIISIRGRIRAATWINVGWATRQESRCIARANRNARGYVRENPATKVTRWTHADNNRARRTWGSRCSHVDYDIAGLINAIRDTPRTIPLARGASGWRICCKLDASRAECQRAAQRATSN